MPFIPMTAAEMAERGWDYLDIIIISGDAYVDHPSFGAAIIARCLEAEGFRVGIISQPDFRDVEQFQQLGKPRLFFGITAGNMDSMVNHYTAQRKLRHDDAYSPGGVAGLRPDRATFVYTNIVKHLYKGVPVIIGGIEASLRRIAHYDYWQDKVRNSILSDSKADILVYGMAERPIVEVSKALAAGVQIADMQDIPSTVVFAKTPPQNTPLPNEQADNQNQSIILPPAEQCKDKSTFHQMTKLFTEYNNAAVLFQNSGGRWIKHNPPAKELSTKEMDAIYELPFEYAPHPIYQGKTIPAFEQIKDSITSHRGCYGGCNFCAIACHQGRKVQSRSKDSIIKEAAQHSGTISDVGGPTANMYSTFCKLQFPDSCKRRSCLFPKICPNLAYSHDEQLRLLNSIGKLPKIKHVFISSGIRHDMAISSDKYISVIAAKYTGGRLKLAPEHCVPKVLKAMGKPNIDSYEAFSTKFFAYTHALGLKRQIIPYLIIGHPGSNKDDAIILRNWLMKNKIRVEQVQEFTPTPMSISTCMYYTGLDFDSGEAINIPSPGEVREQKKIVLWK
ncbi:MAG: YgiQ family radical SAM protein [Candidatus Cloacimonetes bacterium]|nr:YgiQ family radical SAM protein [Candidatus Cloacimonadota bacterium]